VSLFLYTSFQSIHVLHFYYFINEILDILLAGYNPHRMFFKWFHIDAGSGTSGYYKNACKIFALVRDKFNLVSQTRFYMLYRSNTIILLITSSAVFDAYFQFN